MLRIHVNFFRNNWWHFLFDWNFSLCLVILWFFVIHVGICFVKFWLLIGWVWIWYERCRHIIGHCGFDPIHLSYFISVLWLLEVDDCFDALCWLAWTCLNFMNLISILPLIQMSWKLMCYSLNVFCLSLNFLGIYWAILVLVWLWSFCLLQCDSKVHSLTCFVHKMDLVHSFGVRPIGFSSCLINLDFG